MFIKGANRFLVRLVLRLARERDGAAAVEYLLLVFLIGMGLLVALEAIGSTFSSIMDFMTNALVEGREKAGL